ncbi:Os12g0267800 [Oryza sativa Japonica Group]|jgi:hypothetical protein|uniref:Os12g0267800 protein n=1 Tax=Oryza sativa subsp. japonica TaxID=39947 RepID=A0A0P0Y8U2_ORYSJ|nr:hypothetical protein EE612_058820 [Oryza sativa]BAT16630.1 Os12g0267800 [Oryza sativa Japonica Group]
MQISVYMAFLAAGLVVGAYLDEHFCELTMTKFNSWESLESNYEFLTLCKQRSPAGGSSARGRRCGCGVST